ncbi:MAG: GGDEF domain-containing protein [Gammaproteobacteria bacterium]|nr:GGDEF domain-containing protein [Gammaproteobacteria bacterium]MCP5200782.1 GGDEF domain-containing protein [Gammaproteobacteria bacterium]
MDQKTTFEQASERLRQALPLMARNRVPIVPPNYAVWYEYVAGSNAALSEALDRILSAGEAVDEAATLQLYRQYFDGADASRAEAAQRTVKKLIEALTESVETAGSEVHRYGQSLQDCAAQLSDDMGAEDLRSVVTGLMESTQQMREGNTALQAHLAESRRETERLREELQQVRMEARHDPLTGLANRAGFNDRVRELAADAEAAGQTHSLVMADIDKFKSINDTYGHLFGDKIIKVVAKAFANLTKGKDLAARFGGEEFVVLLPDTSLEDARALAENIRASIERGRVYNPKTGEEIRRVTISLGVTELVAGEAIEATVERADEALYRAKTNGRNRVEVGVPSSALAAAAG